MPGVPDCCPFPSSFIDKEELTMYTHVSASKNSSDEIVMKRFFCVSATKGLNNLRDYCSASGDHGYVLSSWLDFSVSVFCTICSQTPDSVWIWSMCVRISSCRDSEYCADWFYYVKDTIVLAAAKAHLSSCTCTCIC